MRWLIAVWLMLLPVIIAAPAQADELRPGYLELAEIRAGEWSVGWKLPYTAPPADTPLPPVLPDNCAYSGALKIGTAAAAVLGSAQARCTGPVAGKTVSMPGLIGQADMLVRIAPLDAPAQALRLTAAKPDAQIARQPATVQVLQTYLVLGVEHILAGWDHLLFVIALVLLVQNGRTVIVAATAFTAAHSLTLAGAALGFVGLPGGPVEALIALSIIFLAAEILRSADDTAGTPTLTRRFPWIVAFLFGLLHGFGFAGALTSIGLPEGDIVAALLAFNVGVEAGQLLVIAVVLAGLAAIRAAASAALEPVVHIASYGIGMTGAYWLIDRVIA
ncbi:HupE/UreJ family protein [Pontixanthobacter sp.]|uniref:HupE/UreJ family protein n=1 Tax=Pontixanthobacter sp. TaxID=2792078 RepID=UPI003C7BD794